MARKRFITPEFFTHADLYDAEAAAGLPLRLCFAGLWTVADRRGVFKWSRSIKPKVLPYDPCDVLACLAALEKAGFVMRYEVDGQEYGYIPSLPKHQSFHPREAPSKDPGPPPRLLPDSGSGEPRTTTGTTKDDHGQAASTTASTTASTSTKKLGAEVEGFADCWALYPKRTGGNSRHDALRAYTARLRDGHSPEVLRAGVERYATFVRATGREGTEFVKQAATFFGPGLHFLDPWDPPTPVESERDRARREFREQLEREEATA